MIVCATNHQKSGSALARIVRSIRIGWDTILTEKASVVSKKKRMTIEEQNRFLHRRVKPFWTDTHRRYDLRACECGGTQGEQVVVIYAGAGDYGCWNIFCRNCKLRSSGESELEAVERWNRGETYRNST